MTINNNFVAVPAQSKSLDTNTVTTAAGVVHRQVVSLASSDTTGTYLGFNSDSAKVYLTNTSLPLPTGASTSALQTTGNNSLSSIDSKITAVNTGAVVVSSSVLPTGASDKRITNNRQYSSLSSIDGKTATLVSGRVPVDPSGVTSPVSFTRLASATDSVTVFQPTAANLNANVSGTVAATQSGTWDVTNVSGVVSLPTGASTAANQTTGNSSLSSIDTKTPALVTGRVPVDGSAVTQPISAASLPLPAGAATQATLSSIDAKFSALGQNTMSASTPVVLSSNHSDISVKNKSSSFSNITTTGTTTIKSGAGIFRRLVINTKGVSSNTFTIYDNTAGSGTVIATVDTVNSTGSLEYGLAFSTGLTIVSASGTSANATVIYE
jgi:hypothetical protein